MDERAPQSEHVGDHWWNGLQVKTYWSGDEAVCHWQPSARRVAGQRGIFDHEIVANLIHRHCIFAATTAAQMAENREMGAAPSLRYTAASLRVTHLRPTPINEPLTIRARVTEMQEGKTVLKCSLIAKEEEHARGEVTTVREFDRV